MFLIQPRRQFINFSSWSCVRSLLQKFLWHKVMGYLMSWESLEHVVWRSTLLSVIYLRGKWEFLKLFLLKLFKMLSFFYQKFVLSLAEVPLWLADRRWMISILCLNFGLKMRFFLLGFLNELFLPWDELICTRTMMMVRGPDWITILLLSQSL